jgi:hypothetical protein
MFFKSALRMHIHVNGFLYHDGQTAQLEQVNRREINLIKNKILIFQLCHISRSIVLLLVLVQV